MIITPVYPTENEDPFHRKQRGTVTENQTPNWKQRQLNTHLKTKKKPIRMSLVRSQQRQKNLFIAFSNHRTVVVEKGAESNAEGVGIRWI